MNVLLLSSSPLFMTIKLVTVQMYDTAEQMIFMIYLQSYGHCNSLMVNWLEFRCLAAYLHLHSQCVLQLLLPVYLSPISAQLAALYSASPATLASAIPTTLHSILHPHHRELTDLMKGLTRHTLAAGEQRWWRQLGWQKWQRCRAVECRIVKRKSYGVDRWVCRV